MLVLSRKEGEAVQIGTSIVRIVKIRGNQVRLGIEAAPDVDIVRHELQDEPFEPLELAEV